MEPDNAALERAKEIEDFVADRISDADRAGFEERLRTDINLRNGVEAERLCHDAKGLEHVVSFKTLLKEVAGEVEKAEGAGAVVVSIGRKSNLAWMAVAASIALIVTVGVTKWMNAPSSQELAMDFARKSMPTTRGVDDTEPYSGVAELDSAFAHILDQQPDKALALLAAYSPAAPELICKRDWLNALALLQLDREAEAIFLLDKVISARCYPEDRAKELRGKL